MTVREGVHASGLTALFRPQTVAIVGASTDPAKLGHQALAHSLGRGFGGVIYGVNPRFERGGEIPGARCVPDVAAIDGQIDLALVAVPAAATLGAVRSLANAGARAAVLAAAGLGELGEPGRAQEEQIAAVAAESGMRLLGPNGFGLFLAGAGLNLTGYDLIPSGRCALVTQSGNVAIALFEEAARVGVGFSCCVGVGNQLDIGVGELARYLAEDDSCDAVALYLEGTRTATGRDLVEGLAECHRSGKPAIVLRAGRSERGSGAATTHTGALGADHRVWRAALDECHGLLADSPEQVVDLLAAALDPVPSRPGGVFVVTDGGGDSVMMLDSIDDAGIPLAVLSGPTIDLLSALVPAGAPRSAGLNPVTLDTAGGLQDDPLLLARCVEAVAGERSVGVIVVAGTFGGYRALRAAEIETVERLLEVRRQHSVPLVVHSAFANGTSGTVERLREGGIPVYPSARRLARAVASARFEPALPRPRIAPITTGSKSPAGALLTLEGTAELLRSAGVKLPPFEVVPSEGTGDQLAAAAERIGFPLCLKVDDPSVSHKSDAGGVVLGLGPDEIGPAAARLRSAFPGARLLVMPMLADGVELLLGLSHDPSFGPFVVVGRGGVTAELDPDVAIALAPVTTSRAREAWLSLRIAPVLEGWRGRPGVDLDQLAELTVAFSGLATADPPVEIECNPVVVYPDGYAVADLRGHVHEGGCHAGP